MIQRIKACLARAMVTEDVTDYDKDLGLDSLILSLLVLELQNEFHLSIPVVPFPAERFTSINTILEFIEELEAQ